MLVLSRRTGEKVVISNGITVTVAEIKANRVRLAFAAPDDVEILRSELSSQPEKRRLVADRNVGKHHQIAGTGPPNIHNESSLASNVMSETGEKHFDNTTVTPASRLPPKTEQTGTVKIITFTAGQVRLENVIASELVGLTDDLGECHLLLDLTNVEYLTGVEIGTLVNLHNKMKASGGRLTLFNLNVQVFEVFLATHLESMIGICR